LHLAPYTLHLTPYTSHLTPYTLHLTPYTSHLTPYTLHLTPYTLHLKPQGACGGGGGPDAGGVGRSAGGRAHRGERRRRGRGTILTSNVYSGDSPALLPSLATCTSTPNVKQQQVQVCGNFFAKKRRISWLKKKGLARSQGRQGKKEHRWKSAANTVFGAKTRELISMFHKRRRSVTSDDSRQSESVPP